MTLKVETTLNDSELVVFEVLRNADEHELWLNEIAKRAGIRIYNASAGVRGLKARGIVAKETVRTYGGQCSVKVHLRNEREK